MALFEDEFVEASDTQLKNHTPDVGTAWTQQTGETHGIKGGIQGVSRGTHQGNFSAGWVASDDLASADHQTWLRREGTRTSGGTVSDPDFRVLVRAQDANNNYFHWYAGTGSAGRRLSIDQAGTVTDLVTSDGGIADEWVRIKAEGTTISLWEGGTGAEPASPEEDTNWNLVGEGTTQTAFQTETRQGLAADGSSGEAHYIAYRAHTLDAGGGATVPIFRHHYEQLRTR